ncbi:MAG: OmpA family protein [Bacteroidetes bacterium]|nr:OmpA family protein [Bacteroidota bacterium]
MMAKKVYLLSVLFLLALTVSGQKSAIKKGTKKIKRGEYNEAIAYFQKAFDDPEYKGESSFHIAEAYRLSNRLHKASPYYKDAINNRYNDPNALFYYAFSLKISGEYADAERQLKRFLEVAEDPFYISRAEEELDNLSYLIILSEKKNYYRVKNLAAINTKNDEYSPVYNNGELYFTSNRESGKIYKATGTSFTDIYKVKTSGANVDATTIQRLGDEINFYNVNEGTLAFSPDGKTMVFARGNSGKRRGTQDVDLYISRFRNKKWSEPRLLSINDPETWDSTPAFSTDGRTLYFASNRAGGEGGIDLYSSRIDRRGRYSKPKNLGPEINTAGDEMFPYVADDASLYFSSSGQPGFGGLDILVAKRKSGRIIVENLGKPMNSSYDDFSFFLYKPDRGFFASNRPESKGNDDIYTFLNNDPNLKTVNYYLAGITKTHDENENEVILANVKVQLLDFKDEVLDELVTDRDGKFNFRVYEQERYTLFGEKQGSDAENYFVTRLEFTTVGKSIPQEELTQLVNNVTFDTTLVLDRIVIDKAIILENIYYDFARWDITPEAGIELDKLVDIMYDNPDIVIELSSHTDSVDTESYNIRLSQRRAESAVNYIVSTGVDRNRITAKGYGESRHIARNTNPDGTDNPEGRAKNRRTEFKVVRRDKTRLQNNTDNDAEFDEDKFFEDKKGTLKKKGNNNR